MLATENRKTIPNSNTTTIKNIFADICFSDNVVSIEIRYTHVQPDA